MGMEDAPRGDALLVRADHAITADLDANGMILDPEAGQFIELNPVAFRMWEMIAAPISIAELCERLVAEYAVAPDMCRAEVDRWLADMRARGLVRLKA